MTDCDWLIERDFMKVLRYLIYGCLVFIVVKLGFIMLGIMNGGYDAAGVKSMASFVMLLMVLVPVYIVVFVLKKIFAKKSDEVGGE